MKKSISILFVSAIFLLMTACNNKNSQTESTSGQDENQTEIVPSKEETQLKDFVEMINLQCPLPMGTWCTAEKMEYDSGVVKMVFTVSDGLMNFNAIKDNDEEFRANMLISFANNQDSYFTQMFEYIIDANAAFEIELETRAGENYKMHFTTDELKENMPDGDADPEKLLQAMLFNTKIQLPQKVDEGTTLTDVKMDDKYFTYVYKCDESIVDISVLRYNSALVKLTILNRVINPMDPVMKTMRELLKATNHGMAYKYVGAKSGQSYTIYIKADEL